VGQLLELSWDNYSNYRQMVDGLRPMPELYPSGPQMPTLVNGACQRSSKIEWACYVVPAVDGFNTSQAVPPLSSRINGKTIHSWGSRDWYERYTL
jgi:hypothetical protein